MKKIKILVLIFTIFLLTGCWNYRELNEMAIVGAIGIDYDLETKEFITVSQIFNAKKSQSDSTGSGGQQQSPVTIYESRAKTIHEALRNVTFESPRKLYLGHIEIIVLGETLAKEHLMEGLDFLFRDAESRKDFDVIVAKNADVKEVLEILTPLENIPSESIKDGLKTNNMFIGVEPVISYDKLLYYIYTPGMEPVLPAITIVGDKKEGETTENTSSSKPAADLKYEGSAIFQKDKMLGYLDNEDSLGYNLAIGKVKSSVISFACDDENNYASIELIKMSSKLTTKIKDNKPEGSINITMEVSLSEINCNFDLTKMDELDKINKMAVKHVTNIINHSISLAQKKYDSDIFGFGSFLYHNQNKYWEKHYKDWNKLFADMPIKVNVKIDIDRKGSSTTSVKNGGNND